MQEGKRQKQVAGVILQEINEVFQRLGLNMLAGGMVSISDVKVTPDLLEARVYLSIFQVDKTVALKKIEDKNWLVKNPKTGKRRNLGTFKSRAAAEKHEREIQYFKRH